MIVANLARSALLLVLLGLGLGGLVGLFTGCGEATKRAAQQDQQANKAKTAFPASQQQPPVAAAPQSLLGQRGVRKMQRALRSHGYEHVSVNGTFGSETREALLAFQRREGLAPTSMPDIATLRRLGVEADQLYRAL